MAFFMQLGNRFYFFLGEIYILLNNCSIIQIVDYPKKKPKHVLCVCVLACATHFCPNIHPKI